MKRFFGKKSNSAFRKTEQPVQKKKSKKFFIERDEFDDMDFDDPEAYDEALYEEEYGDDENYDEALYDEEYDDENYDEASYEEEYGDDENYDEASYEEEYGDDENYDEASYEEEYGDDESYDEASYEEEYADDEEYDDEEYQETLYVDEDDYEMENDASYEQKEGKDSFYEQKEEKDSFYEQDEEEDSYIESLSVEDEAENFQGTYSESNPTDNAEGVQEYEEYFEEDYIDEASADDNQTGYYEDNEFEYLEDNDGDEYYEASSDQIYDEDDYEDLDEELYYEGRRGKVAAFFGKIRDIFQRLNTFDVVLALTAIVILVIGGFTLTSYAVSKNMNKQVAALAPVGKELSDIGVVGESSLLALADHVKAAQEAVLQEVETTEEQTEEAEENADDVKVSFTSVEKDLKIKFTYGTTGNLVTGVPFEVELTNAKGKATVLKDDDEDGVIYQKDMAAGTYSAIVKSVGDFEFPQTAQKVVVKDKIEYVVINVKDEIKTEAQVNVAAEDTAQVNAAAEAEATPAVKDTVEWVESSKKPKNDEDEYSKISKDDITDPSTTSKSRTIIRLSNVNVELSPTATVKVGETTKLEGNKYVNSSSDTEKITYSYEWSSSDSGIAQVSDDGTVTGKKAGTATITYKIKKKTEKASSEKSEENNISVDDYNKLSDEEKAKCKEITEEKEITNEAGETKKESQITGYIYTTKTTVDGETSEESGTATCTITVAEAEKPVTISGASLSLKQSEATVKVNETVTISPAKLVYKYTNDKTEEKTSDFPTIKWTSSDTAIATVDDKGNVKGVKAGSATITAAISGIKDAAGKEISVSATCKVTVQEQSALAISLDQTKANVAVGKTLTLKPTVSNYKSDQGVTWATSDEKIATVNDKGEVKGVKVGSVTITVTTKEKNAENKTVSATCTITVTSDAAQDTKTKLKDNKGRQVYIKDKDGKYVEATYADYYTAEKFYIKNDVEYNYTGWQTIDDKTYFFDKNGKYVTGTQIIQGVEYNFTSDGVLKMGQSGSNLGIDVSKWNGNINWSAVKNSGVDFAIIRCGYRGSSTGALIEDPTFKKNIQGAKAAGIKVGVYFFTQAVNEVEAVEEASMAIALAKNYGLTYPIFIDTEGSGGRADGISKDARTAAINAFCRTVANSGYKAGIYASKSWYETKLHTGSLNSYKIWLAQYSSKPTYGGRYDMWQYTSKGSVGGISGKVDMNISYLGY